MKRFLAAVVLSGLSFLPASTGAAAMCIGDCSGDGQVTVDELILGINIALGEETVDQCMPIDANGDGAVTVDEIVGAVNAALNGCSVQEPRLIVLSRGGEIASLDLTAPWSVRGSADLHAGISSARCRNGRCLVVHPSPTDAVSVVNASNVAATGTIVLEEGADPRDVAFVDDHTAVISQYGSAELLVVDLDTRATEPIDLSALADEDGVPEALRLAICDRRVFVQLQRIDRTSEAPAAIGAALAVIDLDRPAGDRVVDADPTTAGVQGVALAERPNFDMPVDCTAGTLYVAEPAPLFKGGGAYEQVDLNTLTPSELPIDTGAQVGGFLFVEPDLYWIIGHTDFGPGSSSHLQLVGGPPFSTYNTFASEHVDELAYDREADLLFFPDPCVLGPSNQSCKTGVHVFGAHTGELLAEGVDVGFGPIEVVVSR